MRSSPRSSNELRKHGYRLTPQRSMILKVIQEAREHLDIEQITALVQQQSPQISLSTIYRTLDLLKHLGLVRESHLPGKTIHYETMQNHAHHHLVCRQCNTTLHLPESLLGNLHEQLQQQYHFHHLTLDLMAAGYCSQCWESMEQEKK